MKPFKSTLLSGTVIPAVLVAAGILTGYEIMDASASEPRSVAANPCAAKNPCAARNPCAAKNPCNPCAAKRNPCNPCAAKNPCNPCAAKNACNPCNPCAAGGGLSAKCVIPRLQMAAAKNPCNPCAAKSPCNPCAAKSPCNPCAAKNPCNPCAAKNPCNPCAAKNPCNPCAAKNPCNPCAARNPCNPCAAKNPCNPCAAKNPCNPCAAKNPCNPCAARNPCNPCAAKNPCNPCAAKNPCNPCNPCAAAADIELTTAEAVSAYGCLSKGMQAGYNKSGDKYAAAYSTWKIYNTRPYTSATHGGRFVNNYANAKAKAYGRYEKAGKMPSGAVLAKDSFAVRPNGRTAAGPLFLMEKMHAGFSKASAN